MYEVKLEGEYSLVIYIIFLIVVAILSVIDYFTK